MLRGRLRNYREGLLFGEFGMLLAPLGDVLKPWFNEVSMKIRWVLLVAISTLSLGLAIGLYIGFDRGVTFWQGFDRDALETRLMVDAKMRVAILKSIQQSDLRHATLLLENLLDGDVIGLSGVLEDSNRKAELEKVLALVAQYRSTTNYEIENKDVAAAVRSALKKGSM